MNNESHDKYDTVLRLPYRSMHGINMVSFFGMWWMVDRCSPRRNATYKGNVMYRPRIDEDRDSIVEDFQLEDSTWETNGDRW